MVSPVTVQLRSERLGGVHWRKEFSTEDTRYWLIGLPPSDALGLQVTSADPSPAIALILSGALGTPAGVTGALGAEVAPVPDALVAVTTKV